MNFFELLLSEFAACSKPQAEIITVKRLIEERNSVTGVRGEPRSFDHGRRKNDAFTHSAALPTAKMIWMS